MGGASHHRLEQLLQKVGVADVAGYSRLMKMDEGSALSDGSDERGRLTAATPYQKTRGIERAPRDHSPTGDRR